MVGALVEAYDRTEPADVDVSQILDARADLNGATAQY